MPLNQASLLYHILRGVACRLCDKPKVGKRFIDTTVDLVWAKCGNGIGWTRRIPAADGGIPSIENLPRKVFAAGAEAGDRCVRTIRIIERDPRVDETHTA